MNPRRGGLGRGLGALIPTGPARVDEHHAGGPADLASGAPASAPTGAPGGESGPAAGGGVAPGAPGLGHGGTDRDGEAALHSAGAGTHPGTTEAAGETSGHAGAGQDHAGAESGGAESGGAQSGGAELGAPGDLAGTVLRELRPEEIRPNPRQPRQVFDEDAMAELAISLREVGMLQPVVVRPLPATERDGAAAYELVMGERRWRAAQQAGLELLPAIVRGTADDAMLRDALLENLHRAQLNPLEEAAAYQQLLEEFGATHEQLAARIGRSRPQISNTIRLLQLPPGVQRRVAAGVLSAGHARALLALPDSAAQEELAARIVAEGLSVRTVEELVALGEGQERPARTGRPRTRQLDPRAEDLASRVGDVLETRVHVQLGRVKSRLVVEVADVEDLQRVVDLIVGRSAGGPAEAEAWDGRDGWTEQTG